VLGIITVLGEWQGEFSDKSEMWKKLLKHSQGGANAVAKTLTQKDDGLFWIDYDSFLMGFSRVDVVLAFQGDHAKSFHTSFPEKLSNHRSTRAFEVALIDDQPGIQSRETVELYVMCIQPTRRGASMGRLDRKVSYKLSDMAILVLEGKEEGKEGEVTVSAVRGEMMGLRRNGHYRLVLQKGLRYTVVPISFGHPAATDATRSFTVRFVADAPLVIRELPEVPRMDEALLRFNFGRTLCLEGHQRKKERVLAEDPNAAMYGEPRYRVYQIDRLEKQGGVVFVYLCVNHRLRKRQGDMGESVNLHISLDATCRGMMCRTEAGFVSHETVAKGKKFQANWRKFTCAFPHERQTRLLMVLVQTGQDSEMGTIKCHCNESASAEKGGKVQTLLTSSGDLLPVKETLGSISYEKFGIFNGICTESEMLCESMFSSGNQGDDYGMHVPGGFDLDLELALASSRGDIELQEALAQSKLEARHDGGLVNQSEESVCMSEEQAVHLALERSKAELPGASTVAGTCLTLRDHQTCEDRELQEAIRRSLLTKPLARKEAGGEVVAIDVDSPQDASHAQPIKKMKIKDSKVIILDDEEGDECEVVVVEGKGGVDQATGSLDDTTTTILVDKRRLAAEAAERRFRSD
jgi:Calpain family cysteine protease